MLKIRLVRRLRAVSASRRESSARGAAFFAALVTTAPEELRLGASSSLLLSRPAADSRRGLKTERRRVERRQGESLGCHVQR